jgi:hypothetical protein
MAKVFTWNDITKDIKISCVANDVEEARNKIISKVRQIDDILANIEPLNEKRRELVKEFHSTPESITKELVRVKIVHLDEQILTLRNEIKANISIGYTSDMSLGELINTEPVVKEFYPVTIRHYE